MSEIVPELSNIAKLPEAEIRAALIAFIAKQQKVEKRRADQRRYTKNWQAKNAQREQPDAQIEHAQNEQQNAQAEQKIAQIEHQNDLYIYNNISNSSYSVEESNSKKVNKSSVTMRARARDDLDREFDEQVWPIYPNKVSKKSALKSYRAARKSVAAQTILDGLQRYLETKPEYQDWSHLATWLNKERWNDLPSAPSAPRLSPHLQVIINNRRNVHEYDPHQIFLKPSEPETLGTPTAKPVSSNLLSDQSGNAGRHGLANGRLL